MMISEDTAPQAKASTSSRKKEVSESKKPETSAAVDAEVASDVSKPLVHVTVSKRTDTQILETAFKTPEDVEDSSGAVKVVKNTEIIEEVSVAHECENLDNNDDAHADDDHDDENEDQYEDDDDDDDGSEQHPGEVSIGKKIWKFLST